MKTYTPRQAAKRIGKSVQWLYRWLREHRAIDNSNMPTSEHKQAQRLTWRTRTYQRGDRLCQVIQPIFTAAGIDWLKMQIEKESNHEQT